MLNIIVKHVKKISVETEYPRDVRFKFLEQVLKKLALFKSTDNFKEYTLFKSTDNFKEYTLKTQVNVQHEGNFTCVLKGNDQLNR